MQKLGQTGAEVVLCDSCEKRISIRGIQMQEKERGEYRVQFFACPHCGKAYQINTTDEKQRELINIRTAEIRKLRLAIGKRFRETTIRSIRKKVSAVEEEMKERSAELREIGEDILKP